MSRYRHWWEHNGTAGAIKIGDNAEVIITSPSGMSVGIDRYYREIKSIEIGNGVKVNISADYNLYVGIGIFGNYTHTATDAITIGGDAEITITTD